MPRATVLTLLIVSAVFPALAQQTNSQPIDVAYVVGNFNELQAYDVDPQTGVPTAVGEPMVISAQGSSLIPAPDDHFVYVLASSGPGQQHLRVFATAQTGALLQPPVQESSVSGVEYFEINPNRKFAYAIWLTSNKQEQTISTIWEAAVNPETGLLSKWSKVAGPFPPNGPCGNGWSVEGFLELDGFNTDGSKFYYHWFCTTYDSFLRMYYARDVNMQTGILGTEKQVFEWFEDSSGDGVWFTPRTLIDMADPAGVIGAGEISVYPPSGGSKPLITCQSEMLRACSSGYGGAVDPAGVFLFLQSEPDDALVTVIDLANERIVASGNHIPGWVTQVSPDLLYTQASELDFSRLQIYVFDPNSGAVRAGGIIDNPAQELYFLVSAVRK